MSVIGGVIFLLVAYVLPIYAGYKLGQSRHRAGWAWGLLLGWIGVLILLFLPDTQKNAVPEVEL